MGEAVIVHEVHDPLLADMKLFAVKDSLQAQMTVFVSRTMREGPAVYFVHDPLLADTKVFVTHDRLLHDGSSVGGGWHPPVNQNPKWHCPNGLGYTLSIVCRLAQVLAVLLALLAIPALVAGKGVDGSVPIVIGWVLTIILAVGLRAALKASDFSKVHLGL